MDMAFYNRTGFTSGWLFSGVNLYPNAEKRPWFKRFMPFVFARYGKDRIQRGTENFVSVGVQMSFTRQGFFRIDTAAGQEPWAGCEFSIRRNRMMASAQLLKWLRFYASLNFSRSVFYDPLQPFSGNSRVQYFELTLQPSSKLSQSISYNHASFDRTSDGARVYAVDIVNTRTIYSVQHAVFPARDSAV